MCRSTEECTFLSGGCEGGLEVIVPIFQKDELSTKAQYFPLSIFLYKMINTYSKFNFKMNTSTYLLLFQDKFQKTFKSIRLLYLEKFHHGFVLENKNKQKKKETSYTLIISTNTEP